MCVDPFRYLSIPFDTFRYFSILSQISFDTFRHIPSIRFRYDFDILRYFFDTISILVSKLPLLKLSRKKLRYDSIHFDTFLRYFFDTFSIFFDTFSIRFRYLYRNVSKCIEMYRRLCQFCFLCVLFFTNSKNEAGRYKTNQLNTYPKQRSTARQSKIKHHSAKLDITEHNKADRYKGKQRT